jgi:ubiquinol-cytochrome c reductase cytochrome b subunit
MGYVLPWGQMSYWGAMVITNLLGAIPFVGESITKWLWGGFSVDNPTLNRFFALHYLLPFIIMGMVILHIWALHVPGNNNPTGVEVKNVKKDTVPFHPYYTVKDGFAIVVFLIVFAAFVFFMPRVLGHTDNYIPANPLVTPSHIVPEWYLLPFYAILRAITFDVLFIEAKLGGVIAMFGAILVLFALPWLDTSKVKSMRYRPMAKWFYLIFIANFFFLAYLGAMPAEGAYVLMAQVGTLYYFAYFLAILPALGVFEQPGRIPESIANAILPQGAGVGGAPVAAPAGPDREA